MSAAAIWQRGDDRPLYFVGDVASWPNPRFGARMPGVRDTIVIGTGSHRATTPAELAAIVGDVATSGCRVVDHSAFDDARLSRAGVGIDGAPVFMNREYVEADRRIIVGFVEPPTVCPPVPLNVVVSVTRYGNVAVTDVATRGS